MKNLSLSKNLLLLGDKSRYIFAKMIIEMLPIDYEKDSILIEHGSTKYQVQGKDENLYINSFKMPSGISLYLLKSDDSSWQDDYNSFSRIIVFEEFPMSKDSTQQLIDYWNILPKNRPPLTIVIMNLPHRQGSTDLDRIDDAIISAKDNYESQGLDVILFNSDADFMNVLYQHESLIQKHKKFLSSELEKIYEREYELDFLYDDFIMDCNDSGGCLNLFAINRICSFDSVKLSNKNSFWDAYNDLALKNLFPSDTSDKGNLNYLSKIQSYILTGDFDGKVSSSEILERRVSQQKAELILSLQRSFLSFMSGGKFSMPVSTYETRDIFTYKKLTSDRNGRFYGINAEYSRKLRDFVEDESKKILKSSLDGYIKFFSEVIQ